MFIGLALVLIASSFPESVRDWALIGLVAGGGAALLGILLPFAFRLPADVMVASNRIVIGREAILFSQIESAIVGTSIIGGKLFPVLSFSTKSGATYLFGLGRKIDPRELRAYLIEAGVPEPKA